MSQADVPLTFEHVFSEVYLKKLYEDRLSDVKFIGLDGLSTSRFKQTLDQEVALISRKVLNGSYCFTRYREKLIVKSAHKNPRQISIPTIRDALTLRALCDCLSFSVPDCRMRPPHDCTKRVSSAAKKSGHNRSFLRMDVKNFYPSIQHKTLLQKLQGSGVEKRMSELIGKAISCPTGFDQGDVSNRGVPQGLSISNILSMVYLHEFDAHFAAKYDFFRYVDDVLVIADNDVVANIHDEIAGYMHSRLGLETHRLDPDQPDKTFISTVTEGTEYLGYQITNSELRIRERSYKKMFRAIVGCLRPLKGTARTEQVLWRLNLIITGCRVEERSVGWVFFFRQATDIKQFHRMDAFVRKQLAVYGLKDYAGKVKRFAKTYHETRYNRENTTYIPDFDHFTLSDMMKAIHLVIGTSLEKLGEMERAEVEEIYWRMVKREVAKLEKETVDFASYFS